LSWHVVKNSPELANHPSYKDTILAWLLNQEFPFSDEKTWELVDRNILLLTEENFLATFAIRAPFDNSNLLEKVSTLIKDGKFLHKFKQFWDFKDLIDQGMNLDMQFYSKKYGLQTLAELATNTGMLALALAFKDEKFWNLFDKDKLFEHVRVIGTQLNQQMQDLIDIPKK
jgi:hypothetical protein